MRKMISVFLCAILLFMFSQPAQAANVEINYPTIGTVIKIIDGDAIWVSLNGQAQNTAYVRFIGVDSNGTRDSLDFLTSYLLGKTVVLVPELNGKVPRMSGRYNLAYVFITDKNSLDTTGLEMINDTVLLKGHGKLNDDHKGSRYYKQFQEAQSAATSRFIGVWTAVEGLPVASTTPQFNSNNAINVNTATKELLQLVFAGVPESVIDNVIRYRESNFFNTVSEIKFVSGITKETYDKYAADLSVTTNINAATERELLSLDTITQSEVAAIIASRKAEAFTDRGDLLNRLLLKRGLYETIKEFITVKDVYALAYTPSTVVNINTATIAQMRKIGFSEKLAQAVIDGRKNGAYSYKTLMELARLPVFSSTNINLHYYEDNITLYTDVNNASEKEMASLFGDNFSTKTLNNIIGARPFTSAAALINYTSEAEYNRIKDFIYVDDKPEYVYTNIAAATKEQLRAVGFEPDKVESILNASITTAADIPVDTKGFANEISIYTNINTATGEELLTLSPKMNGAIVNAIVAYRNDQPFGSLSEVQSFFSDRGIAGVYTEIRSYIVVR